MDYFKRYFYGFFSKIIVSLIFSFMPSIIIYFVSIVFGTYLSFWEIILGFALVLFLADYIFSYLYSDIKDRNEQLLASLSSGVLSINESVQDVEKEVARTRNTVDRLSK